MEKAGWETRWLTDYMGYYMEPYSFYLEEGINTIRLSSVREPMLIDSLIITQKEDAIPYSELEKIYEEEAYVPYDGQSIVVQGEHAILKSDATLYAINDRSSPSTEPYDVSKIRLNAIGGYRWNQPGQWIAWAFKSRQNVSRGVYSGRSLTVDGEVPFLEAENLRFYYSTEWQMHILGQGDEREAKQDDVEPMLLYLTEGRHDIRLEVVLGEFADIIRSVEDSIQKYHYADDDNT